MSYIGRGTDAISNVEKLDNITFNGGTTYALTKSSAAFTPVGANNILVSIDGVIQQGNFSVSTTNIVFDWSPTSSNTCDFVLHYGTGVLNVSADGAVSTAKIAADAVTGAKIADDQIDSEHYADGSIDTAHLGNLQVTTAKIAADAIDGTKLADDAVNSEHYTDGSIDLAHMSSESVDEDNLHISNAGTNGQALTKQSGNAGGLTWADAGGFDVTSITGATALTAEPAATDEMVISDAGTLKRLDMTHMMNTPCVKFDNTAAITCPSGAETMLFSNNTSRFNVGGTLTSGGRWTPGVVGWYFCSAYIQLGACTDTAEQAELQLWKNGASYYGDGTEKHFGFQTNTEFNMNSNLVLYLDADDYIEYKLWHNAGEDCDVNGDYNSVQAWRILGAV